MTKLISPQVIRQVFVLLLIVLLGGLIFAEMLPYLPGVLGAITFFVLLQRPMTYLLAKKWNVNLAAAVLLLGSFIGVLIPVTTIVLLLGKRLENALGKTEVLFNTIKKQIKVWEDSLGYKFTDNLDWSSVPSWLSENVPDLVGSTFNMFISIAIMYVMLFYMLTNKQALKSALVEYIPISKDNLKIIGRDSLAMVKSNAIGIPLVALAQGIVALIGFLIFNIPDPFFWGVIVFIGSMIPFVGTLIGTLPVFAIALIHGNTFQAWGILIYGFVIVGSTDNLLRLVILKRLDDVHPVITLIGVVVGVPLFGFIGLVFGPLLISLFLLILRIYKQKYGKQVDSEANKYL
ncbi:AI-2E family transporter [Formosa sp. S-31]|uniref:AI-2E family transporter n=1 Tax=Formosa sp. S-31 TaxID=2790949 RepID=UPI003EB9717D